MPLAFTVTRLARAAAPLSSSSGLLRWRHAPRLLSRYGLPLQTRAVSHALTGGSCVGEDGSEDALVRLLVQDAFHPATPPARDLPPSPRVPLASVDGASSVSTAESSHESVTGEELNADTTAQSRPLSNSVFGCAVPIEELHRPVASTRDSSSCALRVRDDMETRAITPSRSLHPVAERFAAVRRQSRSSSATSEVCVAARDSEVEWLCLVCKGYSSVGLSRETCQACGASSTASLRSSSPPVRHVALMPAEWICVHCAHHNQVAALEEDSDASVKAAAGDAFLRHRRKFFCGQCARPFTGLQEWTCPSCQHLCPRAATQCPTCFASRPLQWTCTACDKHPAQNSIFASACHKCAAATVPKLSDSVVRCPCCGGWNDVRWELCATCMAPTAALAADFEGRRKRDGELKRSEKEVAQWCSLPDALHRDAAGRLQSKTVEAAQALLSQEGRGDVTLSAAPGPAVLSIQRHRVPVVLNDRAWWCSNCSLPQRRNVGFCDVCLVSRESIKQQQLDQLKMRQAAEVRGGVDDAEAWRSGAAAEAAAAAAPAMAAGDWRCPYCSTQHSVEERTCCGRRRGVPPNYWLCEQCGSTNRAERAACLGCGLSQTQGRGYAWECLVCAFQNTTSGGVCGQCGHPAAAPGIEEGGADTGNDTAGGTSLDCQVCGAPNLSSRLACYRCHARLHETEWACESCGRGNAVRNAIRCVHCAAPRQFDMREELWLCELCSTTVYSGGALPLRTRCPKCHAARAPSAVCFPARWKCTCGVTNRARVAVCPECGGRRQMAGLSTTVSCPHCFRETVLDAKETCSCCGESLEPCFEVMEQAVVPDAASRKLRSEDLVQDNSEADGDGEDGAAAFG